MSEIEQNNNQVTTAEQIAEYKKLDNLEKEIKARKEVLKNALMDAMDRVGLRKMESDQFSVTLVETQRPKCEDITALEAWHKERNLAFDVQEVPADWVMNTVKESVKKGEVPDGIKVSSSIFLKVTPKK